MGIPTLWSLIEDAIRKGAVHKAQKASSALEDWKQRRIALSKDEPECLVGVDELYGHGAPSPTNEETRKSIEDIVTRAIKDGASTTYVEKLRKLILIRFANQWRLMLGLDPPAGMEPMVITFDEEKFPKNIQPRKYGPEQKHFLQEAIPRMIDAGILQKSSSRFGCCPFTPYKPDGSLRFCLDSRPANKISDS